MKLKVIFIEFCALIDTAVVFVRYLYIPEVYLVRYYCVLLLLFLLDSTT